MRPSEDITSLSHEELVALVAELQRQVAQLQGQLALATATIEALRAENAQLQQSAKRQAAPFSRPTRIANPKRPGRKPGSGTFSFRKAPQPHEITEPPVDVRVQLEACPACGGALEEERVDMAYVTELPAMPKPTVTAYRVQVCRCSVCGKQVRGEHPDVAPDQYGASAHRVGARAMAAAHALHYWVGIPVQKVPSVLSVLTGLSLTQGALTQDALRRAKGEVGEAYESLRRSVKDRPLVHTDDTGWRVGGQSAHLMAFETDQETVYQVRQRHRNEEVREVVPADYAGVMSTDRGRSYDAKELSAVRQQKCLSHIKRSIACVLESKTGGACSFGKQLSGLLSEAIALWRGYHAGEVEDFAVEAKELREAISYHLRDRVLTDPDNQRLLDELGFHHDRGNLLRFLDDPRIEPTNNRAERALRPAVIARKVSQCSKNELGAYAFSAFTSVVRTLAHHRGEQSMVEGLYRLFSSPQVQRSPP
jgi:transposase